MNNTNEDLYGYMKELTVYSPDGSIVYKVGENYPLPLELDAEGEALFFGEKLQINLLWSNVVEDEKNFLHGLCQWLFIYKDPISNVIFLGLGFSRKSIVVAVTSEEEMSREWRNQDIKKTWLLLCLIEATNQKILQMRNLGLQGDYIEALRDVLEDYEQPTPDSTRKCLRTGISDMFERAKFKWVYSARCDRFISV